MVNSGELDAVNIVLLGGHGAGKSSCGNTILNKEVFTVGKHAEVCVIEKAEVGGMQVTVVDTPSWNCDSAEDSSDKLKQELKESAVMFRKCFYALLLVYPLESPFEEQHKITFEKHLELLGSYAWDRTMVLFSRGDLLGEVTIAQHIDKATEELKWLVEKCSHRYHVFNNENKNDKTQVTELLEKINRMFAETRRGSKNIIPPEMAEKNGGASGAQEETM